MGLTIGLPHWELRSFFLFLNFRKHKNFQKDNYSDNVVWSDWYWMISSFFLCFCRIIRRISVHMSILIKNVWFDRFAPFIAQNQQTYTCINFIFIFHKKYTNIYDDDDDIFELKPYLTVCCERNSILYFGLCVRHKVCVKLKCKQNNQQRKEMKMKMKMKKMKNWFHWWDMRTERQ